MTPRYVREDGGVNVLSRDGDVVAVVTLVTSGDVRVSNLYGLLSPSEATELAYGILALLRDGVV